MKCPQCGYSDEMAVKPAHNIMHNYVDPKTGKVDGCYNSEEVELTVKGVKLVRQDKYVKPVETPAPVKK